MTPQTFGVRWVDPKSKLKIKKVQKETIPKEISFYDTYLTPDITCGYL